MAFHVSGITSITFFELPDLRSKRSRPCRTPEICYHPCQSSSSWSFPYRWHPFLFRPFYLVALVHCLFQTLFTAWLMIPAVPCHCLSFRYHHKTWARLIQIRCALNLNISVEWELLDSNTSPCLQWKKISMTLGKFSENWLTGFGSKEKNSSYASFIAAKSSMVVM